MAFKHCQFVGKSIDEGIVEFLGQIIEPDFQTTVDHTEWREWEEVPDL